MNRVFCFHQSIHGMPDPQHLIDLWADTWSEHGWIPSVLGPRDAMAHPGFQAFAGRMKTYPTINPPNYELACYLRHLAVEWAGGGVLTDYDVMNRGYEADASEPPVEPLFLEPTRVPCAVAGSARAFKTICGYLSRYEVSRTDRVDGRPHVSDMTILRQSQLPYSSACVEHLCSGRSIPNDPGDGWKAAPLIHFSTGSLMKIGQHGRPKAEVIREIMDDLPEIRHGLYEADKIPQL